MITLSSLLMTAAALKGTKNMYSINNSYNTKMKHDQVYRSNNCSDY